MEIIDSKKAYNAPKAKVVEVKVQGVLYSSPEEQREDWENGGDI